MVELASVRVATSELRARGCPTTPAAGPTVHTITELLMPAPLLAERTGRRWRRAGPLWGNRDFLLLWSGQTLSVLGSQASALAFPLLVLELTQSPVRAGVVGFVAGLPVLLHIPGQPLAHRLFSRGGHRTPIPRLYMCGAGTHPGGDVSGAPGHNAAHVILTEWVREGEY